MTTKINDKSNTDFNWTTFLEDSVNPFKSIHTEQNKEEINSKPTEPSKPTEKFIEPESVAAKRISLKQRKASFEEYKDKFLNPPKITDRKTVYLSADTRDRLEEIVRRLGERGSSVSGFIENMAKEHLETFQEEIDRWKRL
jgi:hypothetical protein